MHDDTDTFVSPFLDHAIEDVHILDILYSIVSLGELCQRLSVFDKSQAARFFRQMVVLMMSNRPERTSVKMN
jgi:hypothetical protein